MKTTIINLIYVFVFLVIFFYIKYYVTNLNTDVKALEECVKKVCDSAKYEKASVHVSSLLTKAVPELTDLLNTHLVKNGVNVSYYEEV